jgi:hypothetical protein
MRNVHDDDMARLHCSSQGSEMINMSRKEQPRRVEKGDVKGQPALVLLRLPGHLVPLQLHQHVLQ